MTVQGMNWAECQCISWREDAYRRGPTMSGSGEWYPHFVILRCWKCESGKPPRDVYFRVPASLHNDIEEWLNEQKDVRKL